MAKKKTGRMERLAAEIAANYQQHKVLFIVYMSLRLLVIAVMIREAFAANYNGVFYCVLSLLLFMIPHFVEKRIRIDVPDVLEIIILVFIFAAEILGELRGYYLNIPIWDTLLHISNGFLCAVIGVALIDILNSSERVSINLSPLFVAVVAFCFSMTIGVLWEFFEFAADMITKSDMQKDTIVKTVSSVLLNPEHVNETVTVGIKSVVVNGETWAGYIDIGLIDTMKDLLVNFIGAVVCSVLGYFYVRSKGNKNSFLRHFILTKIPKTQDGISDNRKD